MGTSCFLLTLLFFGSSKALYPFGDHLDQQLPKGDDVYEEVQLTVPVKFYGQTYQSVFVNGNGLLSFLTEIPQFFNEPFPLEYPVVAPFYSNVDTRGTGTIFYRESRDQDELGIISRKISTLFPSFPDFRPVAAFIATWDRVGYYNSKSDKVNTYQAVITSDGSETFVELLYPENGISWIRAESIKSSLPDARGQAGVSSPAGKLVVLKGSGTERVYNLPRWTNTLTAGEYMFRVGNIEDSGIPELPHSTFEAEEEQDDQPLTCSDGALLCHKSSDCVDQPEGGFCCHCQKGFFGDGRNCLDYSAHRMIGGVNISLNGQVHKNLNVQAYIVTGDGRTYTAISGVPPEIGYSMQLLLSLGSFVGFLFAKPIGDAPNGYHLTGGLVNHTVDITFGSNRHVVKIRQRYLGLDLFEQVKMEAEIDGSLPEVTPGSKLNIVDFQEHYTKTSPGIFRSQSRKVIEFAENSQEPIEVFFDQTVHFKDYCPSANKGLSSLRLKSSRHYLNYEPRDKILRLASTNKISQNDEGQDPCIEGQVTCVINSSCLIEDDSFRCVCNPGFQTITDQSDFGCVDINECEEGSANCDRNALCLNEVGTYSCQCFPGFTGDGRNCEAIEKPKVTLENGYCNSGVPYLSCNCNHGFEKDPNNSEIGFACEDVDECSISQPCDSNAKCINTLGSFSCMCQQGFSGNGFNCNEEEASCNNMECPKDSICRETSSGPVCFCPEGYSGSPPDCVPEGICRTDRDCQDNGICQFNQTVGYYMCTCQEGYVRDKSVCLPPANEEALVRTCSKGECWCPQGYTDNGKLCIRNPVTTTSQRPPSCREERNCNKNARCIYVKDRREYECKCNPGFEGDGYSCTEFEMSCNQSPICDQNAECRYDSSSQRHICICNEGYQGDGTTCYPMIEPQECPHCHEFASCVYGTCQCSEGYSGDGIENCEKDVQGCDTLGNCSPNADCLYDPVDDGNRCKCRTGFSGDGYTCDKIITCHEHPEICSEDATCVFSHSSYTFICQCNEGFYGNGSNCREINRQKDEFLLLNKGRSTIQLPFQPDGNNIGRPIQINGNQRAIGIAVDCIEGRVYWSDISNQKIKSSKYNGSDVQEFITSGVKSPEGLTIDWINRVLYWTDSGLRVIASARLDSKEIITIITDGLVNPRGIAVHPQLRKIFWSDWNRRNPIIERADLDGRNREVLIQSPRVKLPNSLAIDWNSNEICWADAGLKTIECFDFLRKIPRTAVQNCVYPFGLAITSDSYYWTDWYTGMVECSKKDTGTKTKSIPLPIGGDDKLYGLAAVLSTCPS